MASNLYICTKKDGSYGVYRDIPGKPSREGASFSAGVPAANGVKQFREAFNCEDTEFHYVYENEWDPEHPTLGPVFPYLDSDAVAKVKSDYPHGTRIRLILPMLDPHPVPINMEGEVNFVDDGGQIHMHWDNGRTLPLNTQVDVFEKL